MTRSGKAAIWIGIEAMPSVNSSQGEQAQPTARNRRKWVSFLLVGIALMVCGVAAILAPAASTYVASKVLGFALAIAGIVMIVQALWAKEVVGFTWQMIVGSAEVAGGILIILNPFKGAAALTLAIAVILMAQGVAQAFLAIRFRPAAGWLWLLGASAFSIIVGLGLLLRFPFATVETPGEIVGLSLFFAGISFLVMSFGLRKTVPA
jgi:uncharacterized membrane protein HdeD (DUF308 family)